MGDIFGGLFDFNGDGRTDAFEFALGMGMMESFERQSRSSSSSFGSSFSDDDTDEQLETAGLSRLDLELMDEGERRAALEDAGFDSDDFD